MGGEQAVISHWSAAHDYGIWRTPPDLIHVSCLLPHVRRQPEIKVHEVQHLPESDVLDVEGVPMTSPARTVLDVASELSPRALDRMIDDALHKKLLTTDELNEHAFRWGSGNLVFS
jgi:predicted transcriptional regulator of viral defense system